MYANLKKYSVVLSLFMYTIIVGLNLIHVLKNVFSLIMLLIKKDITVLALQEKMLC